MGKMESKRKQAAYGTRAAALILVLLIALNFIGMLAAADNAPPTLTGGTVTPRKGYPNIDYTYTVTYTDPDNDAPAHVRVFIDGEGYDMGEVDPLDTNYTDGKDYSFVRVMDEGSYTIYYGADDGQGHSVESTSFTLSVTWDVGHYDIIHFIEEDVVPGVMMLLAVLIVLVFLFCVIMMYMVLQLRRIARGMEGRGAGENDSQKEKSEKADKEKERD